MRTRFRAIRTGLITLLLAPLERLPSEPDGRGDGGGGRPKLGNALTPIGAERAGNAAGTHPGLDRWHHTAAAKAFARVSDIPIPSR